MDSFRYDDDDEQAGSDGEGEGDFGSFGGSVGSVYLIDAAEEMFDTSAVEEEEDSPFIRSVKAVHATLMRKIISSNQDLHGVVLFNTGKTKNTQGFPNIFIFQELERPGAESILALEELMKLEQRDFERKYQHSTSTSLHEALRVCQSLLTSSNKRFGGQSILLFTSRDDPHANEDQKKNQARQKVHDLKESGIGLEVLHLGQFFDINKFYKDLIIQDENDAADDSQEKLTLADPSSRFEELMDRVRRLDHKQRTSATVSFTLVPGVHMSVSFYTSISKMTKPSKVKLCKTTNEQVQFMKKEFLEETGELLMPSDYVKIQQYANMNLRFTIDETKHMRQVHDTGIQLLGFKPLSSIKPYFCVKRPNFIYPNEKSIKGSRKMFAALLKLCVARQMVPLVRVMPRRNASLSWAALIPQQEVLDAKKSQITPPGFIVHYLPYADDFRNIQMEEAPRASTEQVDAMKAVVKNLSFKYSVENFDNPTIQTHWTALEALALNRAHLEPVQDDTVPDDDMILNKAGNLLDNVKNLMYPDDYDPNKVKKRPVAAKTEPATKRVKADPATVDVESMARSGKADKLTVDILKGWLQQRGVRVTGKKKAQLVQDVKDELNV